MRRGGGGVGTFAGVWWFKSSVAYTLLSVYMVLILYKPKLSLSNHILRVFTVMSQTKMGAPSRTYREDTLTSSHYILYVYRV